MGVLLGFLLPLGIGAAISPIPTATCLMLLSTNRRPLTTAIAFLVGSGAAFVAVGMLSLAVFGDGGIEDAERSSDLKNTIDALIGGFFLAFAVKLLLKAPDPNAPPPRWLAGIGSIGMVKATLFGMVMSATNFSSLPLYLSGLKEIVTASIGFDARIIMLALFVVLVEAGLLVPIGFYAITPRRAGIVLGDTLRWIEKHNRSVNISVLLVFGVLLLAKGVIGLWDGA